ncbi:MAG: hypothetical protein HMLIMOIP_002337 [Candidatus Nitrosomirales archaeon]|jgi:hypothetical protein
MRVKLTLKQEKERRIKELTSWAISYRIRDRKIIIDEDIASNHVSRNTASDDAKAVMRELRKHDSFVDAVAKGVTWLQNLFKQST